MASCSSSSATTLAATGRGEYAEESALTGLLSDDALLHMMRCLSSRELLSSVAFVCRRWRRLCCSFLVYELVPCPLSYSQKPWGNVSEKKLLALARSHSSTLERLSLQGLKQLTSTNIIALCQSLPKLQDLAIVWCPALTSADLEMIANQLPTQLVSLDLHMDHAATRQCHGCINGPPPLINDEALRILSRRCPQLRKLDLDYCSQITKHGLDGLLQSCQFLTSLDLHSHSIGWPEVAKVLTSCKAIRHFSVVSADLLPLSISSDDETIDYSVRGFRGKGMKSRGRDGVSGAEVVSPGLVMPNHLTSIRFYSSPHGSVPLELSPMLGMLRASGHQLQHLHAQGVFNASWQTISVWCVNLKVLDLSQNTQDPFVLTGVEEVVLCGLLRLLKKLERIALPAATDHILTNLGQYCPNLREIRFQELGSSSNVDSVTDRGVVAVAEGCPALRVLSLAGCRNLTISSARALAFHCRDLKVLILSRCAKFKDAAVVALLPRLSSSLLFLDLVGCQITQATLQVVGQYAGVTSLRVLAIGRPLWLEAKDDIASIQKHNPRLKIRSVHGITWDGFYHGIYLD